MSEQPLVIDLDQLDLVELKAEDVKLTFDELEFNLKAKLKSSDINEPESGNEGDGYHNGFHIRLPKIRNINIFE